MRHLFPVLLPLLLVPLALACAASSAQNVPMPSQEVELSDPSLARVYLTRTAQTRGTIRDISVYDGQTFIGTLGKGEFMCWERRPGRSLLKLVYHGGPLDGDAESLTDLETVAGNVYYYAIEIQARPDNPQDANRNKPLTHLLEAGAGRELVGQRSPAPSK